VAHLLVPARQIASEALNIVAPKGGATATLIPVPLAILKFQNRVAANSGGTSKSAALVRHDFAVRAGTFVSCAAASTASSAQRLVTIAKRASCGAEGAGLESIAPQEQRKKWIPE
jgi:hypothetical protein